jgi:tRNA G18 (ribose-2'-O)-methylase SpoU
VSSDTPSKKVAGLSRDRLIALLVARFHEVESQWNHEQQRIAGLNAIRELLEGHRHEPFIGRLADHLHPDEISLEQLYTLLVPIEREHETNSLRDEDFLPSAERGSDPHEPLMPVTVVLDNLRSAFNIGSIFRTCECLGIEQIVTAGYTATPEHAKVRKAALGAEAQVRWRSVDRIQEILTARAHKIIALEQSDTSQRLSDFSFDFPCTLILGNERFGLNASVVDAADEIVHIPMHGTKQSLNVGVAFAMCAYEMRRQFSG